MKISKAKLRQIIREELNENEWDELAYQQRQDDYAKEAGAWYDDENETRADRKYADRPTEPQSPRRVQRAHALTKGVPIDALLQALRVVSSPMLDATIRKLAFDTAKDLEEADFNDFVAALED